MERFSANGIYYYDPSNDDCVTYTDGSNVTIIGDSITEGSKDAILNLLPEADNPNLSGYRVLITCPAAEFVIYPNFACTDALTEESEQIENLNAQYPIMKDLPIKIDYFEGGHGNEIRYDIEGDLDAYVDGESTFKIIITDYTGGNYEAALTRIRDLGYNPDDYTIEYTDLSQAMTWWPAY